jgi:hypothetical protein
VSIPPSRSCDPESDWRSPSVTLVDGEDDNKEAGGQGLEDQALLELPPHGGNLYNDIATGSFVDDALWVDDVGGAECSTIDPTSVSAPIADACSGSFEDLLDPALFCSVSPTSQPSDSDASQGIDTPQGDVGDEFDLTNLDSLLSRHHTHLSCETHKTPGHEKPTESNLQLHGWVEVSGPEGKPILQELSDDESASHVPIVDDMGEEQWLAMQFAHDKPVPASGDGLVPKETDLNTIKCPICRANVSRPSRSSNKRLNVRQQMAFCNAHKLKDAETEWARRGYPRIGWRKLDSRLIRFTSALRGILDGNSRSFYRTELETALTTREGRKFRCMDNATAGYYNPRRQQVM